MSTPLYIEARIRGPIDDLWELTQTPELHQRWDLRFSEITYLSRLDPAAPQHFRYTTRVGFGLAISGEGTTTGDRTGRHGQRVSALTFWSDDPRSLIRRGSGYWKYIPTDDGIRFVTAYDYDVRFGAIGRALDQLLFRPLMGWATAWSFDRLRLWVETGQPPEAALRRSMLYAALASGLTGLAGGAAWSLVRLSPLRAAVALGAGSGAIACLAGLGARHVPLARRCLRRQPGGTR